MCYYCRYLAHEKSVHYNNDDNENHSNVYSSFYNDVKSPSNRSCHLIVLTLFFVLLNLTIVLCQSSQIQQQRDQTSSKLFEKYSQGRHHLILFSRSRLINEKRKKNVDFIMLMDICNFRRGFSPISFFLFVFDSVSMNEKNLIRLVKNLSKHLGFLIRFTILILMFFFLLDRFLWCQPCQCRRKSTRKNVSTAAIVIDEFQSFNLSTKT